MHDMFEIYLFKKFQDQKLFVKQKSLQRSDKSDNQKKRGYAPPIGRKVVAPHQNWKFWSDLSSAFWKYNYV